MGVRQDPGRLPPRPRFRPGAPVSDAAGVLDHRLHNRRHVRIDTEGIFPDAGYRHAARHFGSRSGHLAGKDDGRPASAFRHHREGSRRLRLRIVLRPELRQYPKYRPLRHRLEVARRPRRQRHADHRPAASEARTDSGRPAVPAGGAGYHRRRPHRTRPIPIRHAGPRPARAEHLGAEAHGQAQDHAAARRCRQRCDERGAAAQYRHQSRRGRPFRRPAAAHRRHPQRCVRSAPGNAVFHQQFLLPHSRSAARIAGRRRHAQPDLCQGAGQRAARAAVDPGQRRHPAYRAALGLSFRAISGGDLDFQSAARRGAQPGR